jgi:hypothetical protein
MTLTCRAQTALGETELSEGGRCFEPVVSAAELTREQTGRHSAAAPRTGVSGADDIATALEVQ